MTGRKGIQQALYLSERHKEMLDRASEAGPYRIPRRAIMERGIELAVAEMEERGFIPKDKQ